MNPLPLGQALADYLRVRRALGFKLDRAEHLLTQYVAYLGDHNVEIPTIEDALAWATLPADANSRWWAHRLSMVRPFAAYLHARDPRAEVVPPALLRSGPRQTIPTRMHRATSPRSSRPPPRCPVRWERRPARP